MEAGVVVTWSDRPPLPETYPWQNLQLEDVLETENVEEVFSSILESGDKSFELEDFYDALWKYEHAIKLAKSCSSLKTREPLAVSNAAHSCLRLGDAEVAGERRRVHWYYYGYRHADSALSVEPSPSVASKAFMCRGQSLQKLLRLNATPEDGEVKSFIDELLEKPPIILKDFVSSIELDPKNAYSLYLAILEAVRTDQVSELPVLTEEHASQNIGTKVLKEMSSSPDSSRVHFECLLMNLTWENSTVEHFDASDINPAVLLNKEICDVELHHKLVGYGMTASASCIEKAAVVLSEDNLDLFKLLLSVCNEKFYFGIQAVCAASNKTAFLDLIVAKIDETIEDLIKRGDICQDGGSYQEALTRYKMAIDFCEKHEKSGQSAMIQVSCAKACINLRRYEDAREHCSSSVKLNPKNPKAYYLRAESLMFSLETGYLDSGYYDDVVEDYVKCHRIQENIDAFSRAIVIAVNNGCTEAVPTISNAAASKEFCKQILPHIKKNHQMTEPILEFLILELPGTTKDESMYDASEFSLSDFCQITTSTNLLKRLILHCGLQVEEKDLLPVSSNLTDDDAPLLELIIQRCTKSQSFQEHLEKACLGVMKARKRTLGSALLNQGCRPPPKTFVIHATNEARSSIVCDRMMAEMQGSPFMFGIYDDRAMRSLIAHAQIEDRKREAKMHVRRGRKKDAILHFMIALKISKTSLLDDQSLSVHKELAKLYLDWKDYDEAYEQANFVIHLAPEESKGYAYSAKALKHRIELGRNVKEPSLSDVYQLISTYQVAFKLDSSLAHLSEALMWASNYDLLNQLSEQCCTLSSQECTSLLKELISSDINAKGLAFLVRMWKDRKKNIKYSTFNMSSFLAIPNCHEHGLLSHLISCDLKIDNQALAIAIQQLPDSQLDLLKSMEDRCVATVDVNRLCGKALKEKKMLFLAHYIEAGARWPKHHTEILHALLNDKCLDNFERALKLLEPDKVKDIDIVDFISAKWLSRFDHISVLIDAGANPDGKRNSLAAVRGVKINIGKKVDIICSLIRRGANCNKLCDTNITTPLHVATEMVIESEGKTELIKEIASSPHFIKSQIIDEKMETPLHVSINQASDIDISLKVLNALLELSIIDPTVANKSGKSALDLLESSDDPRAQLLTDYMVKWTAENGLLDNASLFSADSTYKLENKRHEGRSTKRVPVLMELPLYNSWELDEKLEFHIGRIAEEGYLSKIAKDSNASAPSSALTVHEGPPPYSMDEWQEWHEITESNMNEPLIVVGGRGTGKTTCCLRRLWKRYENWGSLGAQDSLSLCDLAGHQMFIAKDKYHLDQAIHEFQSMPSGCDSSWQHCSFKERTVPSSFAEFEEDLFPSFLSSRHFYAILDNSLDDDENFFKTDDSCGLPIGAVPLDYEDDNQDILWWLLEPSFEKEIVDVLHCKSNQSQKQNKYTEITAVYFEQVIWPKLSKHCEIRLNPSLLWWEIQHVIKGSLKAVIKGSPLSIKEYKELDPLSAPIFSDCREVVYKLYTKYQQYVRDVSQTCCFFDVCDLVLNIHHRLKKVEELNWSIDDICIDDAHNFNQAELALFIVCSKDPNSVMFCGDNSQVTPTGLSFHLKDVQKYFSQLQQLLPAIDIPLKIFDLTASYNTSHRIIELANSIAELTQAIFPDSSKPFQCGRGIQDGPLPVFLNSCEKGDLLGALDYTDRDIQFGSHQVVLIKSEATRKKLPHFLQNAVVLTVDQAEGMELKDVLLYNFFSDLMADKHVWERAVSFYEQEVCFSDNFSESRKGSRSVLYQDLCCLLSAVRCAKRTIWMFDSDLNKRAPILKYWQKRKLVELVTTEKVADLKRENVFTSKSTNVQWKAQGFRYQRKQLWEQAMLCYSKAGPGCLYLLQEVKGYSLFSAYLGSFDQALCQKAALSFLERDNRKPSVRCINCALCCILHLKWPQYITVVNLLELLGKLDRAAYVCLKNKDYDIFAQIQEAQEERESVVFALESEIFQNKSAALTKSWEYEQNGYVTDPKFSPDLLSYKLARFYFKRKEYPNLLEVLKYSTDVENMAKMFKKAKLYDEAFLVYFTSKHYLDAHKLALGQGWFSKASDVAIAEGNDNMLLAQAILLEAKEHVHMEHSSDFSSLQGGTKNIISKVAKLTDSNDGLIKAEAFLVLGMLRQSQDYYMKAVNQFEREGCKAGMLESMNLLKEASDEIVLNCCHIAKALSKVLQEACDLNADLQQTMKFYGLLYVENAYLVTEHGLCFVSLESLLKHQCKDDPVDLDGMIHLKPTVREIFAQRFESFVSHWLARFNLKSKLLLKCQSLDLHSELWQHRQLSCQYTTEQVSESVMLDYIQNCLHVLELKVITEEKVDGLLAHLEVIFSPSVSVCLPCLSRSHILAIRKSAKLLSTFRRKVEFDVSHICRHGNLETQEKIPIDLWLSTWRLGSISYPNIKILLAKMEELDNRVNEGRPDSCPPGFTFRHHEKCYLHIFHFWLQSCFEIRANAKALLGAKLAILHFLGSIAESSQISISISNIVNVLTVHCMALFAIIAHASCSMKPQEFVFPQFFQRIVVLFDSMNTYRGGQDFSLFSACNQEVVTHSDCLRLINECRSLLNRALGYLVGTEEGPQKFCVLRFAMHKYGHTAQAMQCLVLTLIILGNLSLIQEDVKKYEKKVAKILMEVMRKHKGVPDYVRDILTAWKSGDIRNLHVLLKLVQECLAVAHQGTDLCSMSFRHGGYQIIEILDFKQIRSTIMNYDKLPVASDDSCYVDISSHISQTLEKCETVDLSTTSKGIVDFERNFCYPCGVCFDSDDVIRVVSHSELMSSHVVRQAHVETCMEFKLFMSSLEDCRVVKMAEEKTVVFSESNLIAENEWFDYTVENLRNELQKYYLIVASTKEKRNWKNGVQMLAQCKARIDHSLKTANDILHEVTYFETWLKSKEVCQQENVASSVNVSGGSSGLEHSKKSKKKSKKRHKV